MITHSSDINLALICHDINKYITGYQMRDYYIFGLQQDERPHIQILGPTDVTELVQFIQSSGYSVLTHPRSRRHCEECDDLHYPAWETSARRCCCSGVCTLCDPDSISIGIRLDIRRTPRIARKLIKTIIFGAEGKLVLPEDPKLNLGNKVKKEKQPIDVKGAN